MKEEKDKEDCPIDGAPEGSFKDKNGYWRRPSGQLLPGQKSLNKDGVDENRKMFKEVCQTYSIEGLSKMYDMFWDDETKEETRVKIQEYFTKYGFGMPASAPEDNSKDKDLGDLLPTIVRMAQNSGTSE